MADLEQRIQTVTLLILSAVAAAAALYWLRPVMIPFVLAVFIAVGLSALTDFQLRRLGLPRVLAVVSTMLLALLLFGLIAALVAKSVGQLTENADTYQARLSQLFEQTWELLPLERFGLDSDEKISEAFRLPMREVGGVLARTTNAILNTLSKSLLVLIFVVYLLLGLSARREEHSGVWGAIEGRVKRYITTKAALSMATGVLVGVILGLLGVELALVFGLFAFLLNFIPAIGSIIATLLPLPVVLLSPDATPMTVTLALLLPGAVQISMGNVLEPKIMGDSLDLHPIAVLIALIFWGILWGIVGMLLAAPITAILKILFERLDHTRPLAELLAGRL